MNCYSVPSTIPPQPARRKHRVKQPGPASLLSSTCSYSSTTSHITWMIQLKPTQSINPTAKKQTWKSSREFLNWWRIKFSTIARTIYQGFRSLHLHSWNNRKSTPAKWKPDFSLSSAEVSRKLGSNKPSKFYQGVLTSCTNGPSAALMAIISFTIAWPSLAPIRWCWDSPARIISHPVLSTFIIKMAKYLSSISKS